MAVKNLPFNQEQLQKIMEDYGTPFHIYDEEAIRKNAQRLQAA
ncbi:MAG: diaminopimelate decarboxylase, partial [Desulfitobacterium hafniense]